MSSVKVLTDQELQDALLQEEVKPLEQSKPVKLKELTKSRFRVNNDVKIFSEFRLIIKLEKGNTWVEPGIIYYLFDKWIATNKRKRLSYKTFVSICNLFLNTKIVKNVKWFGIDEEFYKQNLTQEVLEKAVKWARMHRGIQKNYKKKN